MVQTKEGALAAADTIREKYGVDHWKKIGKLGGQVKVPKGFALMTPKKRSKAGHKGGKISRRGHPPKRGFFRRFL